MKKSAMIIRLIAAICCSAVTVWAGGARVLLLGDNGSQDLVAQSLNDAGMQVTAVNNYADWDGVTPSATNFDVLILLDGRITVRRSRTRRPLQSALMCRAAVD